MKVALGHDLRIPEPARIPRLIEQGKNPLQLDSKAPALPLDKYIYNETRYSMLRHGQPEVAKALYELAEQDVRRRWKLYEYMAAMPGNGGETAATPVPAGARRANSGLTPSSMRSLAGR